MLPPSAAADLATVVVGDDALARLAAAPDLVAPFRDPHLQRVLRAIDGAPNRVAALQEVRTREGARFNVVVDAMLLAIGAAERGPDGGLLYTGLA